MGGATDVRRLPCASGAAALADSGAQQRRPDLSPVADSAGTRARLRCARRGHLGSPARSPRFCVCHSKAGAISTISLMLPFCCLPSSDPWLNFSFRCLHSSVSGALLFPLTSICNVCSAPWCWRRARSSCGTRCAAPASRRCAWTARRPRQTDRRSCASRQRRPPTAPARRAHLSVVALAVAVRTGLARSAAICRPEVVLLAALARGLPAPTHPACGAAI